MSISYLIYVLIYVLIYILIYQTSSQSIYLFILIHLPQPQTLKPTQLAISPDPITIVGAGLTLGRPLKAIRKPPPHSQKGASRLSEEQLLHYPGIIPGRSNPLLGILQNGRGIFFRETLAINSVRHGKGEVSKNTHTHTHTPAISNAGTFRCHGGRLEDFLLEGKGYSNGSIQPRTAKTFLSRACMTVRSSRTRETRLNTETFSLVAPIAYQRFTSSQKSVGGPRLNRAESCSRTLFFQWQEEGKSHKKNKQRGLLFESRLSGGTRTISYNEIHKNIILDNLSIEQTKYTPSKHIEYQLATPTLLAIPTLETCDPPP